MKAIVIYYSMSGNTRKIANAIRNGMAEVADQCDIVAIRGRDGVPEMKMGHLLEYDLIGVGAPIWRSAMTPNMLDFINSIPTQETQYWYANNFTKEFTPAEKQHCFFFITHGKSPGLAVKTAWEAMNARGLLTIGWDDWYGNPYMTYAQKPWQTVGHPDDLELKEAEEFGRQMVARSRRISQGETGLIPELPTGKEYQELYGPDFDPKKYSKGINHFYGIKIDKAICTECGNCVDNCPTGAIDLSQDNPILPTCIWCTTCEMVCPEGAVDVNMAALKKDRGVTNEEIYAKGQELNKIFEERQKNLRPEKRMRWYIEAKNLFTDGYVSDEPNHPRIIIPKQGWNDRKNIIP